MDCTSALAECAAALELEPVAAAGLAVAPRMASKFGGRLDPSPVAAEVEVEAAFGVGMHPGDRVGGWA